MLYFYAYMHIAYTYIQICAIIFNVIGVCCRQNVFLIGSKPRENLSHLGYLESLLSCTATRTNMGV